ncbi:MAG: phage tape measure protein [Phycisphaerales bacterium]|nr:phage tape measure protein [Phycisphaerales bacterium]
MGAELSKLAIVVTTNSSGVTSGFRAIAGQADALAANVEGVSGRMTSALARTAVLAGTAGVALIGGLSIGKGISLAADYEQAEVAITTMLRSAAGAKQLLGDLSRFAAETPFEFPELLTASKKLVGFGVAGKDVLPTLRLIGDVAAGVSVPIGELADVFGRNLAAGRLFTKDINEFQGRGIPIVQALQQQFKKTRAEILGMVEAGKIGSADLVTAFQSMAGPGGQFFGLMDAQSRTLGGLFSTLKDNVGLALRDIGMTLITELNVKAGMTGLTTWIQDYGKLSIAVFKSAIGWIKENATALKVFGSVTAGVVGAILLYRTAMMACVAGQQAWAAGQAVVLALQGPKGWATLAAGAAVAGAAYWGVSKAFASIKAEADKAAAAANGVTGAPAAAGPALDTAAMRAKSQQEAATGAVNGLTEKLKEQIATLGMSKEAVDIWGIAQQGATEAQLEGLRGLSGELAYYQKVRDTQKELANEAKRMVEEARSPWEKLNDQLNRVNEMEKRGLLTADQAAKLSRKYADDAAGGSGKTQPKLDVVARRFTAGFTVEQNGPQERLLREAVAARRANEQTATNTDKLVRTGQTAAAAPVESTSIGG